MAEQRDLQSNEQMGGSVSKTSRAASPTASNVKRLSAAFLSDPLWVLSSCSCQSPRHEAPLLLACALIYWQALAEALQLASEVCAGSASEAEAKPLE
jgi:hypothetical protein